MEILIEVEDAFDITVEDAEAEKMATPRDLIDSVLVRIDQADSSTCLTQRAFNLVRQALLSRLSLKRCDIQPTVSVAKLVPKGCRATLLEELAMDLKTSPLPDLQRPQWLLRLFAAQSITVGFIAGLTLHKVVPQPSGTLRFFVGLTVAVVAHACTWIASAPLCTQFPSNINTVGGLARWVMAHKSDLASPTPGRWTCEQVAARVRQIVVDQLGCEKTYREDASFVKDLGLS